MDTGSLLWSFAESCETAASLDELSARYLLEMERLGFPYVALSSHVDPLNPPPGAVMVLRYPQSWVAHYSAENFQNEDPVFDAATRRGRPFHWDEPAFVATMTGDQRRVFQEGSEAGIAHGFTIPIRGPDALPASCSMIPDAGGVDPLNYRLVHTMSVLMHEAARRLVAQPITAQAPRLTKLQRRCLTMVARGKSDWAISSILGVSEKSVYRIIERARAKLGVATRTQAIVHALYLGAISLYDVMD